MRQRHCLASAAAALITAAGLVGTTPVGASAEPRPASGGSSTRMGIGPENTGPDTSSVVTLFTGDRVTLNSSGPVRIDPAEGRHGIHFATYRDAEGHVHVLPSDAENLVAEGRLDRNLFDVTALAAYGYDSGRAGTPLIVKYGRNGGPAARGRFGNGGARLTRELPSVDGAAVESSSATAASFWNQITTGTGRRELRAEIGGVWLDRRLSLHLDSSVPQVGAPRAWAAGYDGAGAKVAVLDSGIDTTHPDLMGKVIAAENFTSEPDARDMLGHGTHVASIVAGTGAASGGAYRGVAPGASLLNGKVCIAAASGNCQESAIIAAMQWAARQGADVVNLSLGGADTLGVDPMEEAVNTLTAEHGTLFVISAGNRGAGEMTVDSPSTADAALSVGAVRDDDYLADFSARGPRIGDTAIKPDLTAPGQSITAAASSTGISTPPGESYVQFDGTSMAAPHVAGAAAILAQRNPGWTGARLKSALMGSSQPHEPTPIFEQGAGRLDIGRGYDQTVFADPPSLSLGRQQYPHDDDPVLERTVTYTNTGTSPLTLSLALTTRDPNGAAAPAGMFSLSTSSITVPAGGSAAVRFTANTALDGAEGHYGGTVTATAGGAVRVVTPYAVDRAVAGGEVTFRHLNSLGEPATSRSTILFSLDGGQDYFLGTESEPMTRYIRQGTYLLQSRIGDSTDPDARESLLVNPSVRIDRDQTITLDARMARPVEVDVTDDPDERPLSVELGYSWRDTAGNTRTYSNLFDAGSNPIALGQVDPDQRTDGLSSFLNITLAQPGTGGDFFNSPRSYHLLQRFEQYIPTGFRQGYPTTSLARVDTRLAESAPNTRGNKSSYPFFGDQLWAGQFAIGFDLPFNHTEYYSTGNGLRWFSTFADFHPASRASTISLESPPHAYTAGTTVTEGWNEPVLGPSFSALTAPSDGVHRTGNTIHLDPTILGDGFGHSGWGASPQYTLRRNGTVVANSSDGPWPDVTVPASTSTYRLEGTVDRPAPAELSTRITTAWTFSSRSPNGGATVRLPLWAVSFRPTVNDNNAARAASRFTFPATLAAQPGSTPGSVRTMTVRYSTNDGASWANATVSGSGNARTVSVTHPNTTGFVSLRATVTDYAGNSVEQTVVRAYKIAP
ncbi:S8 family serine peptidase [Plantactinospora sp. S1510]|uniref:S8 family serine peptidase n=1 Tax=Plantactinospora alkalitolerans TaxID=2789879 RepID=A0ABS0H1F4_9ACTN|nr:S8 family serine peptidase [Plantactinospora alkalitolerans]MBF9132151.1 S8 family serine peptidase [Plantactinospora alkalitolerans]